MQSKGSTTTALAGIVGIILIFVVIGAAIYFIFNSFSGDDEVELEPQESAVLSLDSQRSVRMTVRGPIVAPEDHYQYQITIEPDSREMTVYQGYTKDRVRSVTLENSEASYEEFVYALEREGIDNTRSNTAEADEDTRGICPKGKLYQFSALDGSAEVESWWRGSCGKEGTLDTRPNALVDLFARQIPSYKDLVKGTGL